MFLVGDSVATVMYGRSADIMATMEEMIAHTRAVVRATERAFVVADMPFMSYQISIEKAVTNAGKALARRQGRRC